MSLVPRSKTSIKDVIADRLSERQKAAIQENEKQLIELAAKGDRIDPTIVDATLPRTARPAHASAAAQLVADRFSTISVGVRSVSPPLRSIRFALSDDDRWWNSAETVDKSDAYAFTAEVRDMDGERYIMSRVWSAAKGRKSFHVEMPDGSIRDPGALDMSRFIPFFMEEALRMPAASPIIICEGYRAAKALQDLGFAAIGTMDGSTDPDPGIFVRLKGRRVLLWPDNDDVGVTLMATVRLRLIEAGVGEILLVRWQDGPLHGDAANLPPTRSEVDALLARAAPWPPELLQRVAEPPRLQRVGHEMHLRPRSIIARGGRA